MSAARTLRHQLTGFLGCSGAAVVLLQAGKRFDQGDRLRTWSEAGALWLFGLGCTAVGLWMLATGIAEIRRAATPRAGPPLPKSLRPSAARGWFAALFGALLAIGVPAALLAGR